MVVTICHFAYWYIYCSLGESLMFLYGLQVPYCRIIEPYTKMKRIRSLEQNTDVQAIK